MQSKRCTFAVALICACIVSSARASREPGIPGHLQASSLKALRHALVHENGFVKVHAAEALLSLSYIDEVVAEFNEELRRNGDQPGLRTGIFRVLVRAEPRGPARDRFIHLLREAYFDPQGPDRVAALESLAKTGYVVPAADRDRFEKAVPHDPEAEVCLRWLLALGNRESDIRDLAASLDSPNARVRQLAAYALRHLPMKLPADVVDRLARAAEREPMESPARVHVLAAAFVKSSDLRLTSEWKRSLLDYVGSGTGAEEYEVALALAERGTAEDVSILSQLQNSSNADVRIGASLALLRIDRRRPSAFLPLDWLVLASYAAAMLGVGWYFSRRSQNSEDYLLAGRSMKALPVGVSYFATLFSTITYLSTPGEIIKNGPMLLGAVLLYPLVFLIVGYLLIPHISRLRVSTAYEILEKRFGVSVRMLGSGIFMALRLAWMAMILFGMSRFVLIPLLKLDPSATPWVAVVLGFVTVVYTSLGGLQAVIWSDAAQTVVLLAGAVLTLATISYGLGGATAWWPAAWATHWEPPRFWFDPGARLTIASAALSQFTWYVCTAGSDQMAVQRYLATKDAATARRMFAISLTCDTAVALILVCIGLALLSFFQSNPQLLPDGHTVTSGADQLYPHFIVVGLPTGVSGIIIAGLAAAAMSSLSSGLNSASSVVTMDWINRFWPHPLSERRKLRIARASSWLLGGVIVTLSLGALGVEGNLLEKAFRFINLFTAPLFVLFFMAMFVPAAKTWCAWVAGLSSGAAAVVIAYTQLTGLSVFWIMPVALLTGITTGSLASLVPIGRRRPMLGMHAPPTGSEPQTPADT